MQENGIRDGAQPRHGVVVAERERLVADVARRHHQRPAEPRNQQVMQRRVRQHHPDHGKARCDVVGECRLGRRVARTIGRSLPLSKSRSSPLNTATR